MISTKKSLAGTGVVMLVDQETGTRLRNGVFRVDRDSVESQVLRVLRQQQSRVTVVPYDPDIDTTLAALRALRPRLVFNLTEWVDGDRRRDHEIARTLDSLDLRYTGTGAEGLRLARDKLRAKKIVAAVGVQVPRHFSGHGKSWLRPLPYPLFVKLRDGDGSDAIGAAALVRTPAQLHERLRVTKALNNGPAMCEEYVDGRDLFVALLGNKPEVLHPVEMTVGRQGRGAPRFATGRLKHNVEYMYRWDVNYRKARLSDAVLRDIRDASRCIFQALKLRDYARIDYRLTPQNRLVFIEANPNPDLGRHTFGYERCFIGVAYPELIRRIVAAARGRYRGKNR